MSLGGAYIDVIHNHMPPLLIHYSTVLSSVVEVFRNSPSTTFVSGRGHRPGVFLAARCQRWECVSRAVCRRCFQVSSAQLSSASAWLHWLSMEREQGDRDWGGPSMMDDTAESSDGECYLTWVSSKEMFLQVCSCSLPSPFQPSVVALWHHRFSLKQDSKLCICEYSFIKQCTLLGFKNNQVFLSDPLKFASDIFWKGKKIIDIQI